MSFHVQTWPDISNGWSDIPSKKEAKKKEGDKRKKKKKVGRKKEKKKRREKRKKKGEVNKTKRCTCISSKR